MFLCTMLAAFTLAYSPECPETGCGDIILPKTITERTPAALLIHGGGWSGMCRRDVVGIARFLADDLGYVVYNVDYRLAGRRNPWPACGEDCLRAARHMFSEAFAAKTCVRPKSILVIGGSAGGHLALWTGLRLGAQCDRIVSISGIADPEVDYPAHPGMYRGLFGQAAVTREMRDTMSVMKLIRPNGPKILLTHATEDAVVPIATAKSFFAAYRAAGNDISLFEYPSAIQPGLTGHCIWIPDSQPHRLIPRLEREIASFLRPAPETPGAQTPLKIARTALFPGFDGKYCKMSPHVATDGKGLAFMTYGMLLLTGSDVFYGSYLSKSADGGATWSPPRRQTEFVDTREHGLRVTRSCNPYYNRRHGLWFGLGLALTYANDRRPFLKVVDGRPHGWPLFAAFDPQTGRFAEPVTIDFPLSYARAYPFGQIVELEDGDMLVPFIYEPLEKARNADDGYSTLGRIAVARCRIDRAGLRIVRVGTPVACDGLRRGVCEPSLVRLGKKFYMTLRSDEAGMWCASDDGLDFSAPRRWTWTDDGAEIGNRNTQQHWMKVGERLYLAYTRVTPTNGHVFRNRAPVFLAAFDPARGGLVRETEGPLVPERGARLGNFCCTEDGHGGAWLLTAEWMQPIGCEKYGSDNALWFVKVEGRSSGRF